MNYRHAFHAGNFADVMKHAVLIWLLDAMARKPKPFFVLDTHAGPGFADLGAGPAMRTGEWRGGIGRLLDAEAPDVLTPYLTLIQRLGLYPGSPAIIRAMLRPGDRLAACELHPEDHAALRARFAGDRQVGIHHRDGYEAVKALLPPPERRGLILLDPPFEAADEFARLAEALRAGLARFPAGVFAAWYPIKHRAPVRDFLGALQSFGIRDMVAAELWLRAPLDPARLNGCGMLIANPPFGFEAEIPPLLDALSLALAERGFGEGSGVTRIADE
ncbi:MAG: 23S rRNA (adenine(2030)-N(6))-methyltransferase RlmJ [Rhodospirillales bacterium]|nr:23S rRNA (adenine(2030)-N(6))-methyltransferase RlmJ [Rhodospirillales bacterium]